MGPEDLIPGRRLGFPALRNRREYPPVLRVLTRDAKASCSRRTNKNNARVGEFLCAGEDSNLRSPKAIDLQSIAIDHSATDAVAAF